MDGNMRFDDLTGGDRFTALDDLWTKLDQLTARRHSSASIKLGIDGYGYHRDSVYGFAPDEAVVFLPPIVISALKMQG